VVHRIRLAMEDNKRSLKVTKVRGLLEPCIDKEKPWGFFDGACQGVPGYCGAGAVLFIDMSQYYLVRFAAGQGTNNRAEFFALWILLKTAIDKGINQLQGMGDSKLVIKWANQNYNIKNPALLPILHQILEVKIRFDDLSSSHIYHEFNSQADHLSKEALSLHDGTFIEHDF